MSRQNSPFEIEMVKAWFSFVYDARPDWLRNYFVFSKAILFIWGLVLGHSVVEYATVCMLMIYLINVMKKHLLMAAIIINILDGLSGLLALSVAYVADAYTDRLSVIVFTSASYIMGLILLWLAGCEAPHSSICYVAIFLIALGKSGRGSTLQSFFTHQMNSTVKKVREEDDENKTRNGTSRKRRREVGAKIWWYSACILGCAVAIFASGMVSKPQSFKVSSRSSFKVSTGVMLLASFLFFYGFYFYEYENPTKRPLGHVFKVLREVISNKVHLWVSFFSYGVVLTTGNTLFITQITNMNLNVASNVMVLISFFFVLKSFISDIVIFLFWWRDPTKKSVEVIRIGAAMICSIICCIAARQVELYRLHIIRKEGLIDDPLKMSTMSVLWLIPQFFFLGLMEGLGGGALVTHFNGHVPESMRSFAEPFSELVVCVGKFCSIFFILICNFWFGQNINVSKVDRYFLVLAILCSLSFCFYLFWWWNFDNDSACENIESNQAGMEKGEGVPEELNGESVEEAENENTEGTKALDNVQEMNHE